MLRCYLHTPTSQPIKQHTSQGGSPLCQSTKNHEKKLQLFLGVLHFFSVSWAQMGHNKLGKTDSRRLSLQASSQVMLMLSGSQLSSWHVVVKVTTFWSNATSSLNVARAGPSSVSHRTLRAGMLLFESWVPSQQNGPTQLQNPGSSFSSSTN